MRKSFFILSGIFNVYFIGLLKAQEEVPFIEESFPLPKTRYSGEIVNKILEKVKNAEYGDEILNQRDMGVPSSYYEKKQTIVEKDDIY